MRGLREADRERKIVELLQEFTGESTRFLRAPSGRRNEGGGDFELQSGRRRFVIETKTSGSAAAVASAVGRLQALAVRGKRGRPVPLVVVPFMGETGSTLCLEAGVSWLDLSGNARIDAPGLRVYVAGRPNRFKDRGRPASVFAPKSSRVVRQLLLAPEQAWSQRDLARATGLDEGYVSKTIRRLEAESLVLRSERGLVRPRDPDLLLNAWREACDFAKNRIVMGHVPARSGEALTGQLAEAFREADVPHAATGLAGAWLLTHFAAFRIATFYVSAEPGPEILDRLGFRPEAGGANVWLVVPRDEGVFTGAEERDGIRCVHPVQVYLDLKGHPERADEAAREVRRRCLKWTRP